MSNREVVTFSPAALDTQSAWSPNFPEHVLAVASDDGIELIELPELNEGSPAGSLGAYSRRGFDEGRRLGFRDATALVAQSAEELIAEEGLGDIPPSILRQVVSALTSKLSRHRPPEPYVEGGLGI